MKEHTIKPFLVWFDFQNYHFFNTMIEADNYALEQQQKNPELPTAAIYGLKYELRSKI